MKISLVAGALCALLAPASAYVGQWHSHVDKSRVNALIAHDGLVYAGTQGGIRRIAPATLAQTDLDNLDGLLDVWITGFAHDTTGALWAVSRDGYLYRLQRGRWEISGRSYAAQQWKMNDRAVFHRGGHLYLGSQKGLTLFEVSAKVSQLNIERFRNETEVSVFALLTRGDTLYAGTDRGVFKTRVYFADPLNPPTGQGYPNLADPLAWTLALPDAAQSLYFSGDAPGDSLIASGPGTRLTQPVTVRAFADSSLRIGDQVYDSTWTGFETALALGGRIFVGGDAGLAVSRAPLGSAPDAQLIAPLKTFPRERIYNIGANGGRVWGHSLSAIHSLNGGNFITSPAPMFPAPALSDRDLRNVRVDGNGDVYLGLWGEGIARIRDNVSLVRSQATDTCLFQAFPNNSWTVVMSLSAPRNGGIYFSVFHTENGADHQIAHLNTDDFTITCPDGGRSVPGGYPHAVHAFSDTLLGVATERGLELFKTFPGQAGPELASKGTWTVASAPTETWDLATDRWGRPWAVIGNTLGSLNLDSLDLSTSRFLEGAGNFGGEDCRSLEADGEGSLWVGCANGLFHVETHLGGGISRSRRYGMDDGLLSLVLHDISADPVTGKVWIATDRGVSMLEGPAQTPVPEAGLTTILPYPNPFRPQHRVVIFDNLPRNSTLRVHNASGTVVRTFLPRDLAGNQAQWDGKNEQGRPVAPGVYLFSVIAGSTVQRGKIIVAR